jgi:hypothetical protein
MPPLESITSFRLFDDHSKNKQRQQQEAKFNDCDYVPRLVDGPIGQDNDKYIKSRLGDAYYNLDLQSKWSHFHSVVRLSQALLKKKKPRKQLMSLDWIITRKTRSDTSLDE